MMRSRVRGPDVGVWYEKKRRFIFTLFFITVGCLELVMLA
jgi:hypothetical protein